MAPKFANAHVAATRVMDLLNDETVSVEELIVHLNFVRNNAGTIGAAEEQEQKRIDVLDRCATAYQELLNEHGQGGFRQRGEQVVTHLRSTATLLRTSENTNHGFQLGAGAAGLGGTALGVFFPPAGLVLSLGAAATSLMSEHANGNEQERRQRNAQTEFNLRFQPMHKVLTGAVRAWNVFASAWGLIEPNAEGANKLHCILLNYMGFRKALFDYTKEEVYLILMTVGFDLTLARTITTDHLMAMRGRFEMQPRDSSPLYFVCVGAAKICLFLNRLIITSIAKKTKMAANLFKEGFKMVQDGSKLIKDAQKGVAPMGLAGYTMGGAAVGSARGVKRSFETVDQGNRMVKEGKTIMKATRAGKASKKMKYSQKAHKGLIAFAVVMDTATILQAGYQLYQQEETPAERALRELAQELEAAYDDLSELEAYSTEVNNNLTQVCGDIDESEVVQEAKRRRL